MARQGTPRAGRELIAQCVFGTGGAGQGNRTLVAYCNEHDSLDDEIMLDDLQQPDETNGYAPIELDGTWDFTGGVASYEHPEGDTNDGFGNPCWYTTDALSSPITGVAIVFGNVVQHFMDLRDADDNPDTFAGGAGGKLSVDITDLVSGLGP